MEEELAEGGGVERIGLLRTLRCSGSMPFVSRIIPGLWFGNVAARTCVVDCTPVSAWLT